MADYNDNLPGGCFVNDLCIDQQGIQLNPELYKPYFASASGDGSGQPASMLVTHGQILITTDPKLCNLINTINELQCRQDELKQNFEPSIKALLSMVVHRE